MTDDKLELNAEMFLAFDIRPTQQITFQQFLTHPDLYVLRAVELIYGKGLNIQDGMTTTAAGITCH
jgi:hypothetical protein